MSMANHCIDITSISTITRKFIDPIQATAFVKDYTQFIQCLTETIAAMAVHTVSVTPQ